jgi:hypothetical protein
MSQSKKVKAKRIYKTYYLNHNHPPYVPKEGTTNKIRNSILSLRLCAMFDIMQHQRNSHHTEIVYSRIHDLQGRGKNKKFGFFAIIHHSKLV